MTTSGKRLAELDLLLRDNLPGGRTLRERAIIALETDNPWELMHCARMGAAPDVLDHLIVRLFNHAVPPKCVNIGGGPLYHHAGWQNFDAVSGALNPRPVRFTPDVSFPYPAGAARIVYSSHCLEHLDDATVDRVLREAVRMLRQDGALVLKLPDFEQVLERWRAGDEAYFDQWGMCDVIPTWQNLGVEATIDAKASFIFCGWWNDAYGDEFGGRRNAKAPGAYHGPLTVVSGDAQFLRNLQNSSPHTIASLMRHRIPDGAHFNHQNAWSRAELHDLLRAHGLQVLSMDAAAICERYGAEIPGLHDMRPISMYAVAV